MLAAAQTLGMVIYTAGPLFDDRMIDYELPGAIELLQSSPSHHSSHSHSASHSHNAAEWNRYAAVLILHAWAINNPSLFRTHINLVLEKLLIAIRDAKVVVREASAELLAACLDIVSGRERVVVSSTSSFVAVNGSVNGYAAGGGGGGRGERRDKSLGPEGPGSAMPNTRSSTPALGGGGRDGRGATTLIRILADAQAGLKSGSIDTIHGSLLTYRELLLHGGMVSHFSLSIFLHSINA